MFWDNKDPIVAAKYLRDRLLDKKHYFTSTSPALWNIWSLDMYNIYLEVAERQRILVSICSNP